MKCSRRANSDIMLNHSTCNVRMGWTESELYKSRGKSVVGAYSLWADGFIGDSYVRTVWTNRKIRCSDLKAVQVLIITFTGPRMNCSAIGMLLAFIVHEGSNERMWLLGRRHPRLLVFNCDFAKICLVLVIVLGLFTDLLLNSYKFCLTSNIRKNLIITIEIIDI